jgi:hypothetical protein
MEFIHLKQKMFLLINENYFRGITSIIVNEFNENIVQRRKYVESNHPKIGCND